LGWKRGETRATVLERGNETGILNGNIDNVAWMGKTKGV
jgi:hypothetical protein